MNTETATTATQEDWTDKQQWREGAEDPGAEPQHLLGRTLFQTQVFPLISASAGYRAQGGSGPGGPGLGDRRPAVRALFQQGDGPEGPVVSQRPKPRDSVFLVERTSRSGSSEDGYICL